LRRGHKTSTAPHKAGNIAPIQGRASPWQGVKGDSVPFAEHETESRPERSSGKARHTKTKGQQRHPPTQRSEKNKKAAPTNPLVRWHRKERSDFPFFSAETRRSRWSLAVVVGSSVHPATLPIG